MSEELIYNYSQAAANRRLKIADEENARFIDHIDALKAEVAALKAAPAGWKLVPVEPTGEMLLVMQDAIHGGYDDERRLYAAIRGAAQGERNGN